MKRRITTISALAVLLLLAAAIVGKDIVVELPAALVCIFSVLFLCEFFCHKDAAFRSAIIGCVTGLVLLLCGVVWARMTTVVVGQGVSAAPSECTGYLVCQNFEGTGYDNSESWTESGTPNEDYTTTILRGSQSLYVNDPATTYVSFSGQTEIYGHALVQFPTYTDSGGFFVIEDSSGNALARVRFSVNGLMRCQEVEGSGDNNSSNAMSTGTPYHIWFHRVTGSGTGIFEAVWSTGTTRPAWTDSNGVRLTGLTISTQMARLKAVSFNGLPVIFDQIYLKSTDITEVPS